MSFELKYYTQKLNLKHAFGISRGTRTFNENVFIELTKDGITGIGEASPNKRYQESVQSVLSYLEQIDFNNIEIGFDVLKLITYLESIKKGEFAAKVAVEMAFWDWMGKKLEIPLSTLWNTPSRKGPKSSFTIGIDSIDIIKQKVVEAEAYPILKVKLGSSNDNAIIRSIREITDKPLWVDANEGWTSIEQAKREIDFLSKYNIELIEQPMPSSHIEDMTRLKEFSTIPLIADESFTGAEDLETISTTFHGINLKLMKVGSIHKAFQIIGYARKLGLKIMIGCMIESALANTAAALLSTWADYADLDSFKLLHDEPYLGLKFDDTNHVIIPEGFGLGVRSK